MVIEWFHPLLATVASKPCPGKSPSSRHFCQADLHIVGASAMTTFKARFGTPSRPGYLPTRGVSGLVANQKVVAVNYLIGLEYRVDWLRPFRLKVRTQARSTCSMASASSRILSCWFMKQLSHLTTQSLKSPTITTGLPPVSSAVIQFSIRVDCSIDHRRGA